MPLPVTPVISYRIFANDGAGGPVNYASPIATVSGLTYTGSALAHGSNTILAVRSYDSANSIDDMNMHVRQTILINSSGVNVTSVPTSPVGVTARTRAGGQAAVEWMFSPLSAPIPTGFHVYMNSGSTVNFSLSPVATVPWAQRRRTYGAVLSGLSDGVTYAFGVRAYNSIADDGNTVSTTAIGAVNAPLPIPSISSTTGVVATTLADHAAD